MYQKMDMTKTKIILSSLFLKSITVVALKLGSSSEDKDDKDAEDED